jgi:hypothetical protein
MNFSLRLSVMGTNTGCLRKMLERTLTIDKYIPFDNNVNGDESYHTIKAIQIACYLHHRRYLRLCCFY